MARITVVDDYPDFLDLMKGILAELSGHQVTGFDSSELTVDDVVQSRPDLIIADPRSAVALARERVDVHSAIGTGPRRVPTIVCSGDLPALEDWVSQFHKADRVYPIGKPFSVDELTALVTRVLATNAAGRQRVAAPKVAATI